MQVAVVGPLLVLRDGRALDLGTPKQQALLALLACAAPRTVSVERIVDELWPDEPPARAMASLQSYVSRLRRVLEPDRAPRHAASVLVSRPPGYLLDLPDDAVDARRLAALTAAAADQHDPAAVERLLGEALELWRGDPLPELGDSPVARAERTRLTEVRLSAVELRYAALLRLGRTDEIVATAPGLLAEHPYRERLWGHLMLALFLAGRQADALAAYRRCRTGLDEDLGIRPGAELAALEVAVLDGTAHVSGWLGEQASIRSSRVAPPVAPAGADHVPGLVGREDVLAELADAVTAVVGGAGRLVLITGEPGIGKSRVVAELPRLARDTPARVVTVSAPDSELTPAFEIWTRVLRTLLAAVSPGVAARAFGPHGNIPGLLDPDLGPLVDLPAPVLPVDAELARAHLYRGLVAGLGALAREQPLIVCIDDAQWLDAGSAALVRLLAEADDAPVLLVVAFRDDDVPDALRRLTDDPRSVVVRLAGLTPDDLAAVSTAAGAPLDPVDARELWTRTGGNPLFATALVRTPQRGTPVPVRVQQVLRARLERLPATVVELLVAAAVLGEEIDIEVLAAVAERPVADLYDVLDLAVVSGVLAAGPETLRLRFTHGLLREVAAEQLGPLRAARLHLRAADALDGRAEPHELAQHLLAAGPAAPVERVAAALQHAAFASNARADYDQARTLLEQALRLLTDVPVTDARVRHQIAVRTSLGLLHQQAYGYLAPGSAEQARELQPLLRGVTSGLDELPAWWFWLSFALAEGTVEDALALAERLAADVPQAAGVLRGHRGLAALFDVRLAAGRQHLERAVTEAAGLPRLPIVDWDPQLGLLAPLALAAAMQDDAAAAQEHIIRAARFVDERTQPFALMYLLQYRAWIAFESGEHATVRRHATRVLELAEQRQVADYAYLAARLLGWAEAMAGEASGVERLVSVAQVDEPFVDPVQTAMFLAAAQLALGRNQEAWTTSEQGLRRRATGRAQFAVSNLQASAGVARARCGELAGAREILAVAVAGATTIGYAAAARRARQALDALPD